MKQRGPGKGAAGWRAPKQKRWTESDGRAMLDALAASGQSEREFAKRHGFAPHKITYWRRRLRGAQEGFVPVRVREEASQAGAGERPEGWVEVALGGDRRLRFVGAWDAASITPWLEALRRSA